MSERWTILVVEHDGEQHYLRHGEDESGPIVMFVNRRRAEEQADFWREGLGDEVQSVNVVPYPAEKERLAR